ncbi:unnamed protein product, partial [Closterium sp. NIES-54]
HLHVLVADDGDDLGFEHLQHNGLVRRQPVQRVARVAAVRAARALRCVHAPRHRHVRLRRRLLRERAQRVRFCAGLRADVAYEGENE